MTMRLVVISCSLAALAYSQKLPAFRWAVELDHSGSDTMVGLGTDSQGNSYLAGSTFSRSFPVKSPVQAGIASFGLYRINGAGTSALGLSAASVIAVAPENASLIYVVSLGKLLRSQDEGGSFSVQDVQDSGVYSIAIGSADGRVLFAVTSAGVMKSVDGGGSWNVINNGFPRQANGSLQATTVWVDPSNPDFVLVGIPGGLARSVDGGATWLRTTIEGNIQNVEFDPFAPGTIYVGVSQTGIVKSTDQGLTFQTLSTPAVSEVLPDRFRQGRLIGAGPAGIFESTDSGATWVQRSSAGVMPNLAQDSDRSFYAGTPDQRGIVRISGDLQSVTAVGPTGTASILNVTVANGQVYVGTVASADIFVSKVDRLGNLIYSTYFGGSAHDSATAMAVDAAGNVFVTGTTESRDFPVTSGAYAASGSSFVFRLNPDGTLGYSSYFKGTNPVGLATDGRGSVWLAGITQGGLPVTSGAADTEFCCGGGGSVFAIGPSIIRTQASLTRFDAAGSSLIFSTYVTGSGTASPFGSVSAATALAVASDGTAYVGGDAGIFGIDASGSAILSSSREVIRPTAMAVAPDGSLYCAGWTGSLFQPGQGAFQGAGIRGSGAIVQFDSTLKTVEHATYFNGGSNLVKSIAIDSGGNVYAGGRTASQGLPTRTLLAGGFAPSTAFLSELSGDLSALNFSSYFGDNEGFAISGVGIGAEGAVVTGGVTGTQGQPANLWLNALSLAPPPALRIDTVENAASLLDGAISSGETIIVHGAGFGADAQLLIGDVAVKASSLTSSEIAATVPADVPGVAATVQVQSGGVSSNQALIPVGITSPGLYSADSSGSGQGYILNQDNSLNTPANPAAPGDKITIFATGVGPVSFSGGYAETKFPVNVFISGFYCAGVAATMGPMSGFAGDVYRITVFVPNPDFVLTPVSPVVMEVNGVRSQSGITISIGRN